MSEEGETMPYNDVIPAQYVGDGPADMHTNTVAHLAGHLLSRPAQGISHGPQPGHGLEGEPTGSAERDIEQTAQNATRSVSQKLESGQQDSAPSFDFANSVSQIRSSLRPRVN